MKLDLSHSELLRIFVPVLVIGGFFVTGSTLALNPPRPLTDETAASAAPIAAPPIYVTIVRDVVATLDSGETLRLELVLAVSPDTPGELQNRLIDGIDGLDRDLAQRLQDELPGGRKGGNWSEDASRLAAAFKDTFNQRLTAEDLDPVVRDVHFKRVSWAG